jgi:hypothetical protein
VRTDAVQYLHCPEEIACVTGLDQPLLVTGGHPNELTQLVLDLQQLGYTSVQGASDPDVALGLLLTAAPPVQTLVCLLDDPGFDSLDFLSQALEYPSPFAVLLIHASPGGELGAALEIATSLRAEVLGALPQPVDLGAPGGTAWPPRKTGGPCEQPAGDTSVTP